MKRLTMLGLLTWCAVAGAQSDWRLGANAGVLLHQEASGNRDPLPSVEVRVEHVFSPWLRADAGYGFGLTWGGPVVSAASQLHRVFVRPEFALPLRTAAVVVAAGPMLAALSSQLSENGTPVVSSWVLRPGFSAGAGFDVHLTHTTLRTGLDVLWMVDRVDLSVTVGAMFDLGGRT